MSGHSKWSTIKRKKGAEDAKRGKIFTRLAREITVAARSGGGDPDSNPTLRIAIDRAKAANMPKDNIKRAAQRGTGEGQDAIALEEITYEGYAPHGVAILIDVVTDNKNRALSEIKYVFNRANGNMASAGAVAWQFEQKGLISVSAEGVDFEEVFMVAAEAGAEDVEEEGENITIYTPREALAEVAQQLRDTGYNVEDFTLIWIAQNEVALDTDATLQIMGIIEKLEELDDVQSVASNLHISDEALATLEAA